MRLLIINGNTTAAMTDKLVAVGRAVVTDDVEITGVTAPFGAAYVVDRQTSAMAGNAALQALNAHVAGHDAVLLGCFGDPGLTALKEASPVPVTGMAEASCHVAAMLGRRFAIVTGGRAWEPILEDFVASIGLAGRLAGVVPVAPTGDEIARDPERSLDVLAAACTTARASLRADVIILGGAGLAGLAAAVRERVGAPVVCSTQASVLAAVALGRIARGA